MTRRKRLSAKAREALWDSHQYSDGSGGICCHCPLPIVPGQAWHEAHSHIPHAWRPVPGDGIAHKKCNLDWAAQRDVPLIAKCRRQRQNHIGAKRPGMGHRPLPCGRNTKWKAQVGGGMKHRLTQGQLLAQTLAGRRIGR